MRRSVFGAMAMPFASVVPVQKILLSMVRMETFAPAMGAAVSRRDTRTSVFCGESLTEMPRFVTCTIVPATSSE